MTLYPKTPLEAARNTFEHYRGERERLLTAAGRLGRDSDRAQTRGDWRESYRLAHARETTLQLLRAATDLMDECSVAYTLALRAEAMA